MKTASSISASNSIRTLVRLRWALTTAALKTSPWQIVAFVLAILMAGGLVAVSGIVSFAIGLIPVAEAREVLPIIVVCVGSLCILGVALMQAMMFGESSTLSMDKFVSYGIADRTLFGGLLVAGLSGLPALSTLVSLLIWSAAYRELGIQAVISQIIAAPCIVITAMCFSKTLLSLFTVLVTSQTGKNIFYAVMIIAFVFICQLPSIFTINEIALDVSSFAPLANILGWLPLGSLFMMPFDALSGNWLFWILRLVIALVFCVVCFAVSTWCLRWQRSHINSNVGGRSVKSLGAFAHMPDNVSGAISARLISLLRRDARQSLVFLMPIFFILIFTFEKNMAGPVLVWVGVLLGGMMMSATESNGLAYDGLGFAMQVIAGTRAIDDRRGRVRVYLLFDTIYFVVIALVAYALSGMWDTPSNIITGLIFTACGWAWAVASLGLAEIFNCTLMYPVPSLEKPFTTPQGRMVAQAFIPFLFVIASMLPMLPTAIVAIVIFATGNGAMAWLLIPVALANGILMLVIGTRLGAKLLQTRMNKVLDTLTGFAALQQ